jgi:hypothetical protein
MIGVPPAFAEDRSEARLPVTVITGFLGSGKTTLVKHILTNQHGLRTAVIVNEFSELGIDSELIVSADDDMVELENGCICCSINNNFMDSIFRILARDRKVDYLVVETTTAHLSPGGEAFLPGREPMGGTEDEQAGADRPQSGPRTTESAARSLPRPGAQRCRVRVRSAARRVSNHEGAPADRNASPHTTCSDVTPRQSISYSSSRTGGRE